MKSRIVYIWWGGGGSISLNLSPRRKIQINIKFIRYHRYLPSSGKIDLIQNALRRWSIFGRPEFGCTRIVKLPWNIEINDTASVNCSSGK